MMKNLFRKCNMVILCIGLAMSVGFNCQAQLEDDEFHYGFYAGATYAGLTNIKTSLIRSAFDQSTFTTSEKSKLGVSAGFFIYNRFRDSKFAVQPEISYTQYGGSFEYSDIDDLMYTIDFNYDYFTVAVQAKVHPTGGLFIGVGPQVGFNIGDKLSYTSNEPLVGPDLQIEQSLEEVIKGRTDFSVIGSLGYELRSGLVFEFRYKQGISDAVETLSNGFYFIENDNISRAFQFNIAYAIPFF